MKKFHIFFLILLVLLLACNNNTKKDSYYKLEFDYNKFPKVLKYKVNIIKVKEKYKDSLLQTSYDTLKSYLKCKIKEIYSNNNALLEIIWLKNNDTNNFFYKNTFKISPLGEILVTYEDTCPDFLGLNLNLVKIFSRFYPILPFNPVKINDFWVRNEVIPYEEKGEWGNIELNKIFKLDSVKVDTFYVSTQIEGNSLLKTINKKIGQKEIIIKSKGYSKILRTSTLLQKYYTKFTVVKLEKSNPSLNKFKERLNLIIDLILVP